MDISTASPIEIDTKLYELYRLRLDTQVRIDRAVANLHIAVGDRKHGRHWGLADRDAESKARAQAATAGFDPMRTADRVAELDAALIKRAEIGAQVEPLNAEFVRRGGWTRAFLVTNVNGHVHRTMGCTTCHSTTQFHWLPELSAKDESEIIDAAGERACTVCYPNAPVDTLRRPTRIYSPDEIEAQKARDARAAAKAEREAKRLAKALLPDGSELRVTSERLATLRSARMYLTDAYDWGVGTHPSYPVADVEKVADAVAAKEGKDRETVLAEAAKRAAKRR